MPPVVDVSDAQLLSAAALVSKTLWVEPAGTVRSSLSGIEMVKVTAPLLGRLATEVARVAQVASWVWVTLLTRPVAVAPVVPAL
ncbi:MAG: hypothetical protein IPN45_03335 [Actinomycetales bacterium]|nr:hypothetical protein [Actinomycetales bacterium]